MKVALVVGHLGLGGAERVAIQLADGLSQLGHTMTIYILSRDKEFYQKPDNVEFVYLSDMSNPRSALIRNINYLRVLRQLLLKNEVDIAVSFLPFTNVRVLLASFGTNTPIIVTEHSIPGYGSMHWMWRILRRALYMSAAKLVSVSKGVDECFSWLPQDKRNVIFNSLPSKIDLSSNLPPIWKRHKHWVIAVGRLTSSKRFDLLISAFSEISGHYPDWGLAIVGEGELSQLLTHQLMLRGMADKIHLFGRLDNPFVAMANAEFLVLSSDYEGFGNVIMEAMAVSTPCISTDCHSGPREIITQNVDGFLVPVGEVKSLSAAMARMMSDQVWRKELAENTKSAVQRFEFTKITKEWQDLLIECVVNRK